jgi:hypothetical protein
LRRLRGVLSQVVGHTIVRALGGEHTPEQFHPMPFRNVLDMDQLAVLLRARPTSAHQAADAGGESRCHPHAGCV